MQVTKIRITEHAARRMAQRNLDVGDLIAVLRFGRLERRTGAEFYFLGVRDVPEGAEKEFARLVGTVVVVEDGEVSTVYRNSKAIATIRRKPKQAMGRRTRWPGFTTVSLALVSRSDNAEESDVHLGTGPRV